MANWCENDLEVSGPKEDVLKFKKQAQGSPHLLSQFVPIPTNVYRGSIGVKEEEKYGNNTWYNWCLNNWGTKWDVDSKLIADSVRKLIYVFDSAWSPPVEWLQKVTAAYPRLYFKLKYSEPGDGYKGQATAHRGKLEDKCTRL